MCGRFNVIDTSGLQDLLRELGLDLSLPEGINIAPTEHVSLIRQQRDEVRLDAAVWWLTPSWARDQSQVYAMFNARSESLVTSPAYRVPFRRQRGLVPMSHFIEWRQETGVKQPWRISNDAGALAVAALWDVWERGDKAVLSCTLVTTAAAPSLQPWHARMPVLLSAEERSRWLDNRLEIAPGDAVFRSELKTDLVLQPLNRSISNAHDKRLASMQGVGDTVRLSM
ncbi:MAG: SOS response-associated peptidase [Halioglobus sp.]|nr:SOS response-associated peptidase [Halioglobus sp.]